MTIIIKVDCEIGEESVSINLITSEELRILNSLLLEIRNNSGYFPTGKFLISPDPSPEVLYSQYPVNLLKGYLPSPVNGIKRILEINVFSENPITLYM